VVSRSFPARFVAGDFHDVLLHGDGTTGVVVADVAGKGFGASLIMASVKAMTPFIAERRSAADTLRSLNRRLCAELGRTRFVALAYARFSPATGTVELANAGMPDPLLLRAGQRPAAVEVPGPRLPLGVRRDVAYASTTCRLEKGARLLLFSDGIPEARLASGEPLGHEALAAIVGRHSARADFVHASGTWLENLLEGVQGDTAPTLADDWTAVVVERATG
jgi:serine phosphatase RsbU (regulator of sigma subunit)